MKTEIQKKVKSNRKHKYMSNRKKITGQNNKDILWYLRYIQN